MFEHTYYIIIVFQYLILSVSFTCVVERVHHSLTLRHTPRRDVILRKNVQPFDFIVRTSSANDSLKKLFAKVDISLKGL